VTCSLRLYVIGLVRARVCVESMCSVCTTTVQPAVLALHIRFWGCRPVCVLELCLRCAVCGVKLVVEVAGCGARLPDATLCVDAVHAFRSAGRCPFGLCPVSAYGCLHLWCRGMQLVLRHFSSPCSSSGRMLRNGTWVLSQLEFGY
jgi:hypothetical protein